MGHHKDIHGDLLKLITLIRDSKTRNFLGEDGHWVEEIQEAKRFVQTIDAQQAKNALQLQGVELYFCVGESQMSKVDFTLPL